MTRLVGQEERTTMSTTITGADALAQGAIEAGVSLVTGYAGAPATSVVNSLLKLSKEETIRVEWTSNEKVAIVALCGDSSFLHSDVNALMDAARAGVNMLVLILDNGITALSGEQPHPGSPRDARGNPRCRCAQDESRSPVPFSRPLSIPTTPGGYAACPSPP
jgi:TPP-dependent indolepyruvate ferredoxin oxidoreductase alpha subunit